jgi:hypothetical protein
MTKFERPRVGSTVDQVDHVADLRHGDGRFDPRKRRLAVLEMLFRAYPSVTAGTEMSRFIGISKLALPSPSLSIPTRI